MKNSLTISSALVGWTYYGETRYTITPRLFVAARVERNDYPFIRAGNGTGWLAKLTDFVDGETGFLFHASDEFEAKLRRLIDDRELRQRVAGNAYRWVTRAQTRKLPVSSMVSKVLASLDRSTGSRVTA